MRLVPLGTSYALHLVPLGTSYALLKFSTTLNLTSMHLIYLHLKPMSR